MIPYLNITFPKILGLQIHMFGILVAIGIVVGARLTHRRGRELGLEDDKVASMITTVLISGFILAHLFAVFAYQTSEPLTMWKLLNPFGGLSSYGGFMGALVYLVLRDQFAAANPIHWYFWIGLLLVLVVTFFRAGILPALADRLRRHKPGGLS